METVTMTYEIVPKESFKIPNFMRDMIIIWNNKSYYDFSLHEYLPSADFNKNIILIHILNHSRGKVTSRNSFHFEIHDIILEYFGLTYNSIREKKRIRETHIIPRQMAFYFTVEYCKNMTKTSIGKFYGGFDHASVYYGCQNVQDKLDVGDNIISEHFKVLNVVINERYERLLEIIKKNKLEKLKSWD